MCYLDGRIRNENLGEGLGMNNSCNCNGCTCGSNSGTLDFIEQPWNIAELLEVSCHCIACNQECDDCECEDCSCSDEVEHLGAGT